MKNFIFYFLFSVSLIAVSSCSDDVTEGIVDNPINNTDSVLEQAKNRILSMGLDTTDMIEIDGYYVVENDILINKDSLFNVPQTRQYSATYFVSNYSLDVYPYAYVMCTKNIVLEPGRYNIISQYSKPLEEQEGASGMHGSTATIVTYYQ